MLSSIFDKAGNGGRQKRTAICAKRVIHLRMNREWARTVREAKSPRNSRKKRTVYSLTPLPPSFFFFPPFNKAPSLMCLRPFTLALDAPASDLGPDRSQGEFHQSRFAFCDPAKVSMTILNFKKITQ